MDSLNIQSMDTMATINLLQGRSNNLEEETSILGSMYYLLNLPIAPCSLVYKALSQLRVLQFHWCCYDYIDMKLRLSSQSKLASE